MSVAADVVSRTGPVLPPGTEAALADWLPRQRWFAGKGAGPARVGVVQRTVFADRLAEGGPRGLFLVVRVDFADGTAAQHYQVPLAVRAGAPEPPGPHVIGHIDGTTLYDALADHELVCEILRLIGSGRTHHPLAFRSEPPVRSGVAAPLAEPASASRPIGAEQSNSCVVVDDRYLLKVFRRLHTGVNPDLELQRALRASASPYTAPLHGAVEGELDGAPLTCAIVQTFLSGAVDGWELAGRDLRRLLTDDGRWEGDGTGFAAEVFAMGRAVASVHADLAAALGSDTMGRDQLVALAEAMNGRLDEAQHVVPGLRRYAGALRDAFAALAALPPGVPVQRVHGDLHLAQVLRSRSGWTLIDFEGEPAAPMAERAVKHSPLRDVAGMLRSFDYAAHLAVPDRAPDPAGARAGRAWADRAQDAFCRGYAAVAGRDPREQTVLLRAYTVHKAVYEAMYEARNRPAMVAVPMAAIDRMTR